MPALGLACFVMQMADGSQRDDIILQLNADPRVEFAQPVQHFQTLDGMDPLARVQPAVQQWRLSDLHAASTGLRVTVAVVDTGVDITHTDLRNQRVNTRNFVDAGPVPAEQHGTAVAGIISAGTNDGVGIAGIAPGASILGLRACWQEAPVPGDVGGRRSRCSSFTLAKALHYALSAKVQVINMSLSGPQDPLLARLLDVASSRGIIVVGAVDAQRREGGFPASHPAVLAISGPGTSAPGSRTLHATDRGVPAPSAGGGWDMVSGSSYAAAQVSGLVALMRSLSPNIGPDQVYAALASSQQALSPSRSQGVIDACSAVSIVVDRCICGCARGPRAAATRLRR